MVAREIAQREQLKALLAGSIASLGSNYVLTLEAVNAETSDVMAREQIEVLGKEQVLTALGTAATQLREKLGESLRVGAAIRRAACPGDDGLARRASRVHARARRRPGACRDSNRFPT
jgi:hypothetical protein